MSDAPTILRFQVHLARPSHGLLLREGPRPVRPERGTVPRVARVLALAHHFQKLIDEGVVASQAQLAALAGLTGARVTQIMNLLVLAPDIQEEILFLPRVTEGRALITERALRHVIATSVWREQRHRWAMLKGCAGARDGEAPQEQLDEVP
jgi:hypothetical protein